MSKMILQSLCTERFVQCARICLHSRCCYHHSGGSAHCRDSISSHLEDQMLRSFKNQVPPPHSPLSSRSYHPECIEADRGKPAMQGCSVHIKVRAQAGRPHCNKLRAFPRQYTVSSREPSASSYDAIAVPTNSHSSPARRGVMKIV